MILDTSAWIELFLGEKRGLKVKKTLQTTKCYTSIISLAEIANWASKEKEEPKKLIDIVYNLSEIINLNKDICILAGELNYKRKQKIKKWGIMDSFIFATSLLYGLKIVTADSDFRDIENAIII